MSDSHSVAITTSPAISIDKTAPAGSYTVGQTITYSFLVKNEGNVTLHGITVTDPLAGLSAISGYATTLVPGASTTGTATYVVTQANVDAGSIVNTATVQGTPPVGGPVGDTDTNTVPFTQTPALAISKTGDVGPVTIGGHVNYTIVVSNVGNVTLHGVVVDDTRLGWSDAIGTLAVGASRTYNLTYGPVSETDLPGPIVNTAIADSDETSPVSDSHSIDVLQLIDLSLAETADATHPAVGDVVTLTLTLSNAPGMRDATGVSVQHLLGAGLQFLSSTPSQGSYDGMTGVWAVGSLDAGDTASLVIHVRVLAHGPFTSAAEVESADQQDIDSIPANAAASHEDDDDSVVIDPLSADLAITKSVSDATPSVGDFVNFNLAVTNSGPDAATGVVVSDALPSGLTYLTSDTGAYNPVAGQWSVGNLAVGATATLRMTARIDDGTLGLTIENVATVVPGDQVDPNLTDNRATASVHMPAADLQVRKTVSNATPAEGDEVTFTITLTNLGPDVALGIAIADLLPTGLTYVSHSGNGTYDEALGAWTLGSLIAGRSASLTITARTAPGTADSTLANIAEVTRSNLPDPDLTNNRDQADVHVAAGGGGGGGAADDCSGRVVINEVAWAGTAADPQGQWIELRNVGTAPVDLTGWTLRWRKKVPVTAEDYVWREVQLSGILQGAATSACALALQTQQTADIGFTKRDAVSWLVVAEPRQDDGSYLLLERKSDETIRNIDADIVYDVAQPYPLALAPEGDVMQLLDPMGSVIDTANAFEPAQNGWPAGDATTFGTMERTDPLAADTAANWHTNIGIVTKGEDETGRPLVATARALNSESLDEWTVYAELLTPTEAALGTTLDVGLDLTLAARRETGWPWIRVSQPTLDVAGGGAATVPASTYTFSTRFEGNEYVVTVDTTGMAPGEHLVWIVFAEGKAVLVPITVLP